MVTVDDGFYYALPILPLMQKPVQAYFGTAGRINPCRAEDFMGRVLDEDCYQACRLPPTVFVLMPVPTHP